MIACAWNLHDELHGKGYTSFSLEDCKRLWLDVLQGHEYFHHLVDAAIVRYELEHGVALYPAAMQRYWALRRRGSCTEEALANAFAYDRLSRSPGWREHPEALRAVWRVMRLQPISYRDFPRYLDPRAWRDGLLDLATSGLGLVGDAAQAFAETFGQSVGRVPLAHVPLYLVDLVDPATSDPTLPPYLLAESWPATRTVPSAEPRLPLPSELEPLEAVSPRRTGPQNWIVNTCVKHTPNGYLDMLRNGKAAAYGDHMHMVDKIAAGDRVFLYHSGVGVIAWGFATGGAMEGRSEFGWDEHAVQVKWEFAADPYLERPRCIPARDINQASPRKCVFLGTAFRIQADVAEAIVELSESRRHDMV